VRLEVRIPKNPRGGGAHFNTSKVRLEGSFSTSRSHWYVYFNTSKVRLEDGRSGARPF